MSSEDTNLDPSERENRTAERERNRLADEVRSLQEQLDTAQETAAAAEEVSRTTQAELKGREPMEAMMANALGGDSFPKFSGDPNVETTFDSFLQDYDIACEAFGLTEEAKKARFLSTRLQGHALQVFKRLVKTNADLKGDYGQLTTELGNYFKTLCDGRRGGTSAFYNRRQKMGESVVNYYTELTKLAKLACPDAEGMPDGQFLERFMRGLNTYLKGKVVSKDPKTSQAALEAASNAERNKMYLDDDREMAVHAVSTNEGKLEKEMMALTMRVHQISNQHQENPYSRQQRQMKELT